MECNKDEAIRAKEIAERKMLNNDFAGANKFALKANQLYANLDGIPMIVAVCEVHCSAHNKFSGSVVNWYDVLQVDKFADETTIKKQYRKLALLLHPDKNKFAGAEAAFKLIGEANRVLSNKMTRSVFDMQVRASMQASISVKPPFRSSGGSSSVNKHPNSDDNTDQLKSHRFQQSLENFWTRCPSCKTSYQYLKIVLGKRLSCQNCSTTYTASETVPPVSRSNVNSSQPKDFRDKGNVASPTSPEAPSKGAETNRESNGNSSHNNMHAPPTKVGLSENNSKQKTNNVKSNAKKTPKSDARKPFMAKAPRNTSNKRGRAGVTESSQRSDDASNVDARAEVNQENYSTKNYADVEKVEHNIGTCRKEKGTNKTKILEKQVDSLPEDKVQVVEENDMDSGITPDISPVQFDYLDPEFYDFDKDKDKSCFGVDQIWAVYDTTDAMPRFYARIRNVYAPDYKLQITWLEHVACGSNAKWIEEDLPTSCGIFRQGVTEKTTDHLMFSHRMRFETGKRQGWFVIYPRSGEIWALFRNWDISWANDPEKHKPFKFDFVVVLSDFDQKEGVEVAYLKKQKGFVSLFQQTTREGRYSFQIRPVNLLQFSHRVPHFQLSGNEREDIPPGSYELDTASLPIELDELEHSTERIVEKEKKDSARAEASKQSTDTKAASALVENHGSHKKRRLDEANQGSTNSKEFQSNHASSLGTSNQHKDCSVPTPVVRRSPRVSLSKNN